MADLVQLIEPFIPGLRRYARSLLKDSAAVRRPRPGYLGEPGRPDHYRNRCDIHAEQVYFREPHCTGPASK